MTKFLPEDELVKAVNATLVHPTRIAAADSLNWTRGKLEHRLREAARRKVAPTVGPAEPVFESDALPSADEPIDDLIERRSREFQRKHVAEQARKLINVKVKLDGPIGICHFGDPHVDDDGCDLPALRKHIEIVNSTPGMFGANVGDLQNNWVGRLSHLWGEQGTSKRQAWRLTEWLVRSVPWLYLVGGNHDCHDVETECLTKRGWLRHDAIRDDDQVLSFVTETGGCEWAPILGRIERAHQGEMVNIETRSVSLSVTPNHRVLCRDRDWKRDWRDWKYVPAGALPPRVALPASAQCTRPGVPLSDDQIALAGWILTDGNISWDGNMPRITLYQSKDGAEIERLLSSLGLEHNHTVRDRAITVVAGRALLKAPRPQHEWRLNAEASRRVLEWLPEKGILPTWADDLSGPQFAVLLDAIVAGDGCWDGADPDSRNVAVVHGAEPFLSSLQAVAVQHGYYARLSIAREKDYRLNLCRRETIQFETKPATTRTAYDGTVWCLTVPRGNFLVRRNGAAHFSGNCWSGEGDPLQWMIRDQAGVFGYDGVRLALKFPNGREIRVNCRHDFAGHSMWNPVHGPLKAAMMGWRDHILTCGHKHTSGAMPAKDPMSGLITNVIRCAGFKKYDHYAKQKGFPDGTISPAITTIIDPTKADNDPDQVTVIHGIEKAAFILNAMRGQKVTGKRRVAA